MTFTYSGNPGASPVEEVRFLLGDTQESEPLVQDEEITYVLTKLEDITPGPTYAAAVLADNIAARYAREASVAADGVNVSLGQVADQFRALAASLRQQHKDLLVGGAPDVGGITPGEGLYPGINNFNFGTGMHDDLEAGLQDYGSRQPFYPAENYPGV